MSSFYKTVGITEIPLPLWRDFTDKVKKEKGSGFVILKTKELFINAITNYIKEDEVKNNESLKSDL